MGQHICTGTRVAHPEFLPGPGIPKQTYGFSVPREDQSIQIKASGVLILGETETEISQELAKEEVDELYDFLLQS